MFGSGDRNCKKNLRKELGIEKLKDKQDEN